MEGILVLASIGAAMYGNAPWVAFGNPGPFGDGHLNYGAMTLGALLLVGAIVLQQKGSRR